MDRERLEKGPSFIQRRPEIKTASDIETVADTVQVPPWRRYDYVRCPEILWGIHNLQRGRPFLVPKRDRKVQEVIRELKANEDTVIELACAPIIVASALWHLNNEMSQVRTPRFSWLFIKPIENENSARFWSLLLRRIGVPRNDIAGLLALRSPSQIVESIAEFLNQFEPSPEKPSHRCPDIVAILGIDKLRGDAQ